MKKIKLTRGQFALVDDEDFEGLNKFHWHASKIGNTFYAARKPWKGKYILMHRQILNLLESKMLVDHIDHNGLNNQRINLRECSNQQNQANQYAHKNTSSRFKGVSWDRQLNKWRAVIRKGNKKYHIGYYVDEVQAAIAFNEKAFELNGEFAYLNEVAA